MDSFSKDDVTAALVSISVSGLFVSYDEMEKMPSSDEEERMKHPVIDYFYYVNKDLTIHHLTTFTRTELLGVFDMIKTEMILKCFTAKGRRFIYFLIDMFLMLLTILKWGAT